MMSNPPKSNPPKSNPKQLSQTNPMIVSGSRYLAAVRSSRSADSEGGRLKTDAHR